MATEQAKATWGSSHGWSAVTPVLEDAAREVVASFPGLESEFSRESALRYVTRLVGVGAMLVFEDADPGYPEFRSFCGYLGWNWALPNPDSEYFYVPLHGDFTYRIFGRRGTPHMLRMGVWGGELIELRSGVPGVSHLESYRRTHVGVGNGQKPGQMMFDGDLEVGPGGEVEVVLSREPHEGNWLKLPSGPCWGFVRHEFYDWEHEELAPLSVERVGATYPRPSDTVAQLKDCPDRLVRYFMDTPELWGLAAKGWYPADPSSIDLRLEQFTDSTSKLQEGQAGQAYGRSNYRCGPDEAVILEFEVPDCTYWSFGLYSPYLELMDHKGHQSSLNGRQAVVDSDGFFRAVISQRDPGIANWLDSQGQDTGLITARTVGASGPRSAHLQVVPFDEVLKFLPPESALVTPTERSDIIRRRWLSYCRTRGIGAPTEDHS